MEIKSLRTLLAVVNHQSFVKAGDAVGLSRSAVSLQIKALEQQLGITLFDRQTRPPVLTADGLRIVEQARQLVDMWQVMEGGESGTVTPGQISIGAVQTVVAGILPHALKLFRARYPEVQINLVGGIAQEFEATLRRGELDAAVMPQSNPFHPGLLWQPFCEEDLVVVAPKRLAGETDAALLSSAPLIRFRQVAWGLGRIVDQELERRGIATETHLEIDTIEGILSLVANGLGVAILPVRRTLKPFPANVKIVPFGDPPLTRTLGVLQRENNPRQAFVQNLFETLSETAAGFPGSASAKH